MEILTAIVLTVINLALALSVLIGVPGTWVMLILTGVVVWLRRGNDAVPDEPFISVGVLIAAAVLAVVGEILEFIAGVIGARVGGASKKAAVGALVGTFIGGLVGTFWIPLPLIGSLIGAAGGAALGTIIVEIREGREIKPIMQAGAGAGVGRLLGLFGKFGMGLLMWITLTIAAFWP